MKFSILLPTHNRLDLLRYAVESVLKQDYSDWELLVSDNASEENIAEYIESMQDKRIKYSRTADVVAVTENWNRCLNAAVGDYVIMLGDDDALMPNYLSTLAQQIEKFDQPDVIFTNAYLFTYPNVLPGKPESNLRENCHPYFKPRAAFLLDRDSARLLVRQWLAFELPAVFNMQFSLVKRSFIHGLADRGPFFQSLFPDFYATIAEFLMAEKILIYQYPLVVIGISPKSHGAFYFNHKMEEAKALLHKNFLETELSGLQQIFLPGDWMATGWLTAAVKVQRNYSAALQAANIGLNLPMYRRKVIIEVCKAYYRDKAISKAKFAETWDCLGRAERLRYKFRLGLYYRLSRLFGHSQRRALIKVYRQLRGRSMNYSTGSEISVPLKNILEAIDYLSQKGNRAGH